MALAINSAVTKHGNQWYTKFFVYNTVAAGHTWYAGCGWVTSNLRNAREWKKKSRAGSLRVTFSHHYAVLFRVPTWGLVFWLKCHMHMPKKVVLNTKNHLTEWDCKTKLLRKRSPNFPRKKPIWLFIDSTIIRLKGGWRRSIAASVGGGFLKRGGASWEGFIRHPKVCICPKVNMDQQKLSQAIC